MRGARGQGRRSAIRDVSALLYSPRTIYLRRQAVSSGKPSHHFAPMPDTPQDQHANFTKYFFGGVQFINVVFFVFFLTFACMVVTKHSENNVTTLQFSTSPSSEYSLPVVNLDDLDNSITHCTSSDRNDYERCAMSKLPPAFTSHNSYLAIWPGRSMNKPFLLFILCMLNVFFSVAFLPTLNQSHVDFVKAKGVLLVMTQLTTLILTSFYQYEWGVGYSSIFIGITFTLVAISYTWSYIVREYNCPDSKSTLAYALSRNTTMQYKTIHSLCTLPLVVYIVLVDLNPRYMDYIYNINVVLSIVLVLACLTLENRLFIKLMPVEKGNRPFNFKTEKIIYISTVILTLSIFMICITYAGDFYNIAHTDGAAPVEAQTTFKLLFFCKLIETSVHIIFYILDEYQSFYSTDPSTPCSPDQVSMIATSNLRFVLFNCTDFVIAATLLIQFWSNVA